jgi:hypothetical protein
MKRTLSKKVIAQLTAWAKKELAENYKDFPKSEKKETILQIIKFFKFLYKKGAVQIELSEASIFVDLMSKLVTCPYKVDFYYQSVKIDTCTYLFFLPDSIPSFSA